MKQPGIAEWREIPTRPEPAKQWWPSSSTYRGARHNVTRAEALYWNDWGDAMRDRLRDTAETLRIFCEAHDEMYVSGEPCHIYNDARAILNRLKEEGLA